MSEQFSEPAGKEDDAIWAEVEAYEQIEKGLNAVKSIGAEISAKLFASKADLNSTIRRLHDDALASLYRDYPQIMGIPLTISGSGVERVVVQIGQENNEEPHPEGVMIRFNRENPFSPVDDFESSEFCFSRLGFKVEETADGQFQAHAFIVGRPPEQTMDFVEDDGTRGFLSIIAMPTLRIDCSQSDSPIEIVKLKADRERQSALLDLQMELDRDDMSTLELMEELHVALQGNEGQKYVNFENIALLHKIGERGKDYALSNPRLSGVLTVAIAKTFGKDSHILFDGALYPLGQYRQDEPQICNDIPGTVVSVLDDVPCSSSSEPTGPTLIIQLDNTHNGECIEVGIPLTSVSRLMV